MSEYVLGRILPVFRGSYEVGTTYNKLDLVYVAGYGTYVAKTTVSSVQPQTRPDIWQIVSKDITSEEVYYLFNENESVRNQMVQTLIDNADEDIQNAITTLTNEITEKLNEVDGKIDGKIDELDGIKSTYTNQFNTLITDQTNTFNSNEEQRESKLDTAITTIQNADTTFKNGLQSEVHEFINTTDAEFEESQRERESEFNSTINSMNTQFNAAQTQRATTFNNSQTERNTQFNQSQTERNTQFTTQMTNQQNEFDSKESERDLATQAIINEHQALLDLDEKKANKDGYYVEMTTGFTEQLLSPDGITDEEPYIYRTSAGSTSISTGVAEIKSLYGNSIVWNQLLRPFSDGVWNIYDPSKGTYSQDEGIATLTYTASGNGYPFGLYYKLHKFDTSRYYLVMAEIMPSLDCSIGVELGNALTITQPVTANVWNKIYFLKRAVSNSSTFILKPMTNVSPGDSIKFKNVNLFDLSIMFGAGNEPTTVEQFKQWFPNDYYEYNAGEIINVNLNGLKTVGFNQWDEEYVVKTATSGNKYISSKNNIKVFPNTTYYFYCGSFPTVDGVGFADVLAKDINGNNIGYIDGGYIGKTKMTFTTPAKCYYISFDMYQRYGATYKNDICINLTWSGYRNGDYEPYNEHNINIPIKEIKDADNNLLFPDGLLSVGSVKDEVTSDKAVKQLKYYKFNGTENWTKRGGANHTFELSNPSNLAYISPNHTKFNWYSRSLSVSEIDNTNGIYYNTSGSVIVTALDCTTVAEFKVKLSNYNLEMISAVGREYTRVPIEVEFKDVPQSFGEKLNLTYFVDDFGTEEFTTTEPTAPVKHSTFYMTNLRDKIRNIDGNTDSGALMNNSLTNLLSTLSNALGGTLTKVWDSNNKVWQFTFTPNQTNGGLNNE